MKLKKLRKKIILIFTIIAMLIPYVPVYTPVSKAETISKTFDYTGGIQTFTAPTTGIYEIEVWGAAGGNFRRIWKICIKWARRLFKRKSYINSRTNHIYMRRRTRFGIPVYRSPRCRSIKWWL